jgi:hypothetical protein
MEMVLSPALESTPNKKNICINISDLLCGDDADRYNELHKHANRHTSRWFDQHCNGFPAKQPFSHRYP